MCQQHTSNPSRRCAKRHSQTNFLRPLSYGMRDDAIDSNECEPNREPGKHPNSRPIGPWSNEKIRQTLFHSFHSEHRNIRVDGSNRFTNRGKVFVRATVHSGDKRRKKPARGLGGNKNLIRINQGWVSFEFHTAYDANDLPSSPWAEGKLPAEDLPRAPKLGGKTFIDDRNAASRSDLCARELATLQNPGAHSLEIVR